MARPAGLSNTQLGAARTIAGVIAADSATLTDANIPPAQALDCTGFDTIFVGVEIAAGSSPTATIEALFRDADAADGSRWTRALVGAREGITAVANPASEDTGALATLQLVELKVFGRSQVFLRVKAVANATSTTSMVVLAMGGKTRNISSLNRG